MFNHGCTADGSLNSSKFNDPMPWIGIYVAAASLICAIAMAMDALHGFRYKKFWFPCRFFSLNATTLTLIAVAIKFSVDLNAAMPRRQDQLAKVSSSAFLCVVMANLLPSLGAMEETELLMNIVALGILVITAIANISSPQFVIGRSAPCSASGAFCLFNTLILAEAMLRSHLMPWSFRFCTGDSDYRWSTTLVLISQTVAVGVGTTSPAFRWFMTINFRCPNKAERACRQEFVVERYWIKRLLLWQVQPLDLRIRNRRCRKLAHGAQFQVLRLLIGMQKGLVLSCKIIRFVSIFFVGRFLRLKRLIKGDNSVSCNDPEMESHHNPSTNRSHFVVHLAGEEGLVDLMMENHSDATAHWIRMGEKQQPKNLIELLEHSNSSGAFTGIRDFDSDKVPSLGPGEPPNCWGLPVVTLTSIAVALPTIDQQLITQLVSSVHEGLKYVNEIENYLDGKNDLKHVRKAAEIVWSEVELYNKWLDVDLRKLAHQREPGTEPEIVKLLADISKEKFMEYANRDMMYTDCLKEIPSRWPLRVLAANSMYRISETLLLGETKHHESSERLFEKLTLMICSIFKAAFTNLQHAIFRRCHETRIEEREKNIRCAVLLFGKTERILKILDRERLECSDQGQFIHIDDWHLVTKKMDPLHSVSSSTDQETASSSPSDFSISIES